MKHFAWNIRLFILIFWLVAYPASAQDDECQCPSGALVVSGDIVRVLKEGSGEVLSINGWRRSARAKSDDVSIYHALIFRPGVLLIGTRTLLSNKRALSIERLSWTVQKYPPDDYANGEEHSLEIQYNFIDKSITVGKKTFRLSNGNLFVIRLDEKWLPTVSQVSARLTERTTPDKVLKFFKSVLRHDKTIQRLELPE